MIEVAVLDKNGGITPVQFNTDKVEIMDGALIVLSDDARFFLAGFAPGQWLSFQNLGV